MNSGLARVLLQKGVIRQGTVLEAHHNTRGLSCVPNANVLTKFVVSRATLLNSQEVWFAGFTPDQAQHRIPAETVVSLDGMAIDRLASSHNLTLEGEQLAPRTRRGRRRKRDRAGATH